MEAPVPLPCAPFFCLCPETDHIFSIFGPDWPSHVRSILIKSTRDLNIDNLGILRDHSYSTQNRIQKNIMFEVVFYAC